MANDHIGIKEPFPAYSEVHSHDYSWVVVCGGDRTLVRYKQFIILLQVVLAVWIDLKSKVSSPLVVGACHSLVYRASCIASTVAQSVYVGLTLVLECLVYMCYEILYYTGQRTARTSQYVSWSATMVFSSIRRKVFPSSELVTVIVFVYSQPSSCIVTLTSCGKMRKISFLSPLWSFFVESVLGRAIVRRKVFFS